MAENEVDNVAGESKSDKFKRLASKRVVNAISKIELITNLAAPSYEYTPEEVAKHPGPAVQRRLPNRWSAPATEPADPATVFLERLSRVFPLEITFRVQRRNGFLFVVFEGNDKQLLLWKDGQLLLALQHILNKVTGEKVQVDCEFFRKRKEKQVRDYALHVAQQVRQSGQSELMDLMNPYERRIVHIAVNQIPGMTSESLGDGFLKRIKVFPAGRNGKRTPPPEEEI